jgi:hypothetical protein
MKVKKLITSLRYDIISDCEQLCLSWIHNINSLIIKIQGNFINNYRAPPFMIFCVRI